MLSLGTKGNTKVSSTYLTSTPLTHTSTVTLETTDYQVSIPFSGHSGHTRTWQHTIHHISTGKPCTKTNTFAGTATTISQLKTVCSLPSHMGWDTLWCPQLLPKEEENINRALFRYNHPTWTLKRLRARHILKQNGIQSKPKAKLISTMATEPTTTTTTSILWFPTLSISAK